MHSRISLKAKGNSPVTEQFSLDFKKDVQRFLKRCGPPLSFLHTRATREYTAWKRKECALFIGIISPVRFVLFFFAPGFLAFCANWNVECVRHLPQRALKHFSHNSVPIYVYTDIYFSFALITCLGTLTLTCTYSEWHWDLQD